MHILLSLIRIFTIMLNFCTKGVLSLLTFPIFKHSNETLETPQHARNIPSPATGLGSITSSGSPHKSANVVELAKIKPPPSTTTITESAAVKPPPSTAAAATGKKDPGGIGFLDEVGGSVDGLMSCTESLGFESSDERLTGDEMASRTATKNRRCSVVSEGGKIKAARKFPPPLSSLSRDGKPTFFLQPVRRDGRLELTEVKIDRLEVLRASREDGRLRLSLVTDLDVDEEETEDSSTTIEEEEEVREREERGDKWVCPVANGGGEGFRRCHEVANHHHNRDSHHNLPAWNQQCLTIR